MKKLSLIAIAALTFSTTNIIQANEIELSANVGATTNYIWRGMTQTDDKASINGGIDLGYKGFYLGTWASTVDFNDDANYELDVYAGYGNSIGNFSYDLSYIKYMYPGSKGSSNFDEVTLAIGYDINKLSLGVSHAIGTYTENSGAKNDYTEVTASYDFDSFSLDTSYGDYDNSGDNFAIGASTSLEVNNNSLDLSLVYTEYDSDAGASSDEDNLYLSISYSF